MAEDRFSKETYKLATLAAMLAPNSPQASVDDLVTEALLFLDAAEKALAEDFDGHS